MIKIESLDQVRDICKKTDQYVDFVIKFGDACSRKQIRYVPAGKRKKSVWEIFHGIDGSIETYRGDDGLLKMPNIELAIKKGLFYCEKDMEAKKKMEAFCVKCKQKCEMKDGKEVTMKNKRKMMKGKCPRCSTVVCRILAAKK